LLEVLLTTLQVAGLAGLLAAPAGIALGYGLARRSFPGKSLVETCVALPIVLPPTAIGYLLLMLLARDGVLGAWSPAVLFTWKAAVLAASVMALPLVARTARTAFEEVDPRLEWMGRSVGLSRGRVFWKITLPLAQRGLLAAVLLGFGRALGEFGATVIVAGNIPGETQTLALAIFQEIQLGDTQAALRLVLLTTLIAFLLVWTVERLLQRQERS
jgi:molybdate transport system permease protein